MTTDIIDTETRSDFVTLTCRSCGCHRVYKDEKTVYHCAECNGNTFDADNITSEFPDFVLDVEIPESFSDESWHNDACPCFISKTLGLALWVDYADSSMRELPDSPRFSLTKVDSEGCHWDSIGDVMASDDFSDITAYISNHSAKG